MLSRCRAAFDPGRGVLAAKPPPVCRPGRQGAAEQFDDEDEDDEDERKCRAPTKDHISLSHPQNTHLGIFRLLFRAP